MDSAVRARRLSLALGFYLCGMEQKRKLLIGGVALVVGNVRNAGEAMVAVCDELDPILAESGWFPFAPFKYVSLIIRYGDKIDLNPEFQPIIKKYGELPIAVELKVEDIRAVHRDKIKLVNLFRQVALKALLAVAGKYGLPKSPIEEYRLRQREA